METGIQCVFLPVHAVCTKFFEFFKACDPQRWSIRCLPLKSKIQESSGKNKNRQLIKLIKTMEESQQLGWVLFGCFGQVYHPTFCTDPTINPVVDSSYVSVAEPAVTL
jgi:hypothetical protein